MNRYTLGASVRMDGSDLFGVDKKYRFLPIYSVSGLYRIPMNLSSNQLQGGWIICHYAFPMDCKVTLTRTLLRIL